jgi:VWFA-related protein
MARSTIACRVRIVRLLGTILVCALGVGAVEALAAATVRFVKPRNLATVVGESTIQLFADVADDAAIDRIEIRLDGKRLVVLSQPPWETTWDAGPEGRGHALEALLYLTDGSEARTRIRTSPLRVNQIENVDLVNLYLVVRDGAGRYVTDLTRDNFTVLENGVPQSVERFATTHKPLRVGITLDSSRSMEKDQRLVKAKKAALDFLDVLEAGDEGTVVSFNEFVHVTQEFSADKVSLSRAIDQAYAAGGTALYDAIWRTSDLLRDFDGRRVMVLLSDGKDESSSGLEPGSLHTMDEALDQALRSEVMIFPIGLGGNLEDEFVRRWNNLGGRSTIDVSTSLADVLNRLADSTGGRAVMSTSPGRLRKAFAEIAADLRHQYSLAYSSSNATRDGKWRSIEVLTPGRTLEVVTRKGYYAPKNEKPRRIGRKR